MKLKAAGKEKHWHGIFSSLENYFAFSTLLSTKLTFEQNLCTKLTFEQNLEKMCRIFCFIFVIKTRIILLSRITNNSTLSPDYLLCWKYTGYFYFEPWEQSIFIGS